MKYYVVTKGSYSDYHIVAVTTDEEKAKLIAEKFDSSWGHTNVETYEEASFMIEKDCWLVYFDPKGRIDKIENRSCEEYDYQNVNKPFIANYISSEHIGVYVCSDSIETAVKIAAERRAKFLAEQEGIA